MVAGKRYLQHRSRRKEGLSPWAAVAASSLGCLVAMSCCGGGTADAATVLFDAGVSSRRDDYSLVSRLFQSSHTHFATRWLQDEEDEDEGNEEEDDGNENEGNEDEDKNEEDDGEKDQDNQDDEDEQANNDEEDANDGDDNNDNNGNDDNAGEEDNQEEEQEDSQEQTDDYFDDRIHDDLVYSYDDDQSIPVIDDYYAFQGDPGPPQLLPLTTRYIIGFLVASMALTLGATGGIGGGGIVVPVYVIIIGLPLKAAIPIGAITVLGGALGSTLLNWTRRHPLADRPLIDWDLILIMEPLTLVGTLVGTLFHRVFSERFLIILLVLLLSATAQATLSKAMRMYQAEKRYIRHLIAAQADPPSGSPSNFFHKTASPTWQEVESNVHGRDHARKMDSEEKQRILIVNPDYVTMRSNLMEAEKFTPHSKIMAAITVFSVVVFLNVMVGGGAYKSPWDIRCGSAAFWAVHAIMIAFLIASAWAAQTYVVARHEVKELVRFDYVHGDIKWDARSAILYPAVFVMAGFFAGTLGIGGGVITVPIMLTMGVHPAVVSATSSTMILFTSLASSSSYLIFGLILKDFAVVGFCIGFIAALFGQSVMRQARQAKSASGRNFERNSYIAFVIGGVVLISALLITVEFVIGILREEDDDDGGLCDGLRF